MRKVYLENLFKPLTDQYTGNYGIRTCAELVRQMNGDIKIESREKEGTEISIKFPVSVES